MTIVKTLMLTNKKANDVILLLPAQRAEKVQPAGINEAR